MNDIVGWLRRGLSAVWLAMLLALALAGCSTASDGPAAASTGVCRAAAVLPDVAMAQRIFINEAHDPLHALAANARLPRDDAARVLTTMAVVEHDFDVKVVAGQLEADLIALRVAADAALQAIGERPPDC
ncbi:MAG: hypothetical protein ABI452_01215 [Candidatus Limnocylindrales bacterium]